MYTKLLFIINNLYLYVEVSALCTPSNGTWDITGFIIQSKRQEKSKNIQVDSHKKMTDTNRRSGTIPPHQDARFHKVIQ